jgi:hypothetical protein
MQTAWKILRKVVLATAIGVAAPWAHMEWGFHYHGPGMNHVELLLIVTAVGIFLAVLYEALAFAAWGLLRKLRDRWLLCIDLVLAAPFFWLSVGVGLSAKIVHAP